ncbi:MAG TPA: MoxR family ATPase [Candidatus Eremiobacteraeota bacterium]|nr:MoxR family ATPase [Candidatus Eremiobacteraeota bacterium]
MDDKYLEIIERLRKNINVVIKGKGKPVDHLFVALLAGGNVLMEDVPGVGKTTLAKGLAKSIQADFKRVQFTPDLLPTDVIGSHIYNPRDGTFNFKQGPLFTNILLADEINRASPRTQSSLLEAMSECQVTVEGHLYKLISPFIVIATQNPVEFHGTYPLPEAQLDRFAVKIKLGYPSIKEELEVLYSQHTQHPLETIESVASREEIVKLQAMVRNVKVNEPVAKYMLDIVDATRKDPRLKLGVSPRGSLMLYRICQSLAFINGRDYTLPDDIKEMALEVLSHRLVLETKVKYSGVTKEEIVQDILENTKVPV